MNDDPDVAHSSMRSVNGIVVDFLLECEDYFLSTEGRSDVD